MIQECTSVLNGNPEFGFESWSSTLYTISVIEEVIYIMAIIIILPVMIKILVMFKFTYCDLYDIVKYKMIGFIIFYELFLTFRAISYGMF